MLMVFVNSAVYGQEGYVKLQNDSTLYGYLRKYVSFQDGHQGFEVWKTKKDKSPRKIPKVEISEYAIKKDTFKVLQQFRPYDGEKRYFELVDAALKARGKVDLYVITELNTRAGGYVSGGFSTPATSTVSEIYILEDRKLNLQKALPLNRQNLKDALKDFFPEGYITKYEEVYGKISFKNIVDFVRLYNSK